MGEMRAIVLDAVTADRIAEILRDDYGARDVRLAPTGTPEVIRIDYMHDDEPQGRTLSVFQGELAQTDCRSIVGIDCSKATLLRVDATGDAEGAMLSVLTQLGGFLLRDDGAETAWEGISAEHVGSDPTNALRFEAALKQAATKSLECFHAAGFLMPDDAEVGAVLQQAIAEAMRLIIPAAELGGAAADA